MNREWLNLDSERETRTMRILSLDLGKYKSVACDYEAERGGHRFTTIPTNPQTLHDLIVEREPDRVVIEICSIAGWGPGARCVITPGPEKLTKGSAAARNHGRRSRWWRWAESCWCVAGPCCGNRPSGDITSRRRPMVVDYDERSRK